MKAAPGAEVVLFQTCFVQHNEPQVGKDALFVLRQNGVEFLRVPDSYYDSMPARVGFLLSSWAAVRACCVCWMMAVAWTARTRC